VRLGIDAEAMNLLLDGSLELSVVIGIIYWKTGIAPLEQPT